MDTESCQLPSLICYVLDFLKTKLKMDKIVQPIWPMVEPVEPPLTRGLGRVNSRSRFDNYALKWCMATRDRARALEWAVLGRFIFHPELRNSLCFVLVSSRFILCPITLRYHVFDYPFCSFSPTNHKKVSKFTDIANWTKINTNTCTKMLKQYVNTSWN